MQKALLIAEKPSLAEAIREGYEKHPDQQYEITYCSCEGHLMELFRPWQYTSDWKNVTLEQLPMVPKKFKATVTKEGLQKYNLIKNYVHSGKFDVVINAGDPAREGELIITEILMDMDNKLPELRLWTEDLTVNGICKAFDNLLPPQNNLKKAAFLRQWRDWLLGINCSTAITLSTGCDISVGRVMSALLAMIVRRDDARRNFTPETYYECEFAISSDSEAFTGKATDGKKVLKFETQNDVVDYLANAQNNGEIIDIFEESTAKSAPLLLNITDLQKEAYSEYGYLPEQTLSIAQSLYMKKLLSYPRTDCRYISDNVAAELANNLKAISSVTELSDVANKILCDPTALSKICENSNIYTDNSKLTDHHALLVTANNPNWIKLSNEERNIYKLVAKRLIAIFMPAKVTNKRKVLCKFGDVYTQSDYSYVAEEGYSKLFPAYGSSSAAFPNIGYDTNVYCKDVNIIEKKTQAPSFYNYKTLLEDMENCGKYAESKKNAQILKSINGLGQASTRAAIIKKLLDLKYIKTVKKGNSTHIEATLIGREIVNLLKDSDLIKVDSTAYMEATLNAVQNGDYDANQYYLEMIDDVTFITEQLKGLPKISKDNPLHALRSKSSVFTDVKCPVCGKRILESDKAFYCIGWRDNTCKFTLKKVVNGVHITLQDVCRMIDGETISRNFKWKSGKSSIAELGLENNQYKFYFNK